MALVPRPSDEHLSLLHVLFGEDRLADFFVVSARYERARNPSARPLSACSPVAESLLEWFDVHMILC